MTNIFLCTVFKNKRNYTYIALYAFAVSKGTNLLLILAEEKYDYKKKGSSLISEGQIIRHFGNIML
jgi:hypothetical protein